MTFTSFEFLLFFLLVLLGRGLVRGFTSEKWLLLIASCVYYMTWSVPSVFLLLLMSLTDYSCARNIEASTEPDNRKRWLLVSLLLNLGLLGFFKYSNFFLQNVSMILNAFGWDVGLLRIDVALPPAISYFTFGGLSYVLDVYYERTSACTSARDYTLYATFFPKLLSGPIVRARGLLPQLRERVRASMADIEVGLGYILLGAVKKLVIADQIVTHVDLIFATPAQYDGLTLLQGLMGYAILIYCDFSGYSDMAIGCARLLGYRFPDNFQMPFSAASITEFWRRWHITLSQWFRDYAFLPLEMATRNNPFPKLRVSINMLVMMLLVGLWHGPSWNFVMVGGIHGVALVIHQLWTTWGPVRAMEKRTAFRIVWTPFAHFLTLAVVLIGFVFFRANSMTTAFGYVGGILSWHGGTRLLSPFILPAIGLMVLIHLGVNKDRNLIEELSQMALSVRIVSYACLMISLVCLAAGDAAPFIYFQF